MTPALLASFAALLAIALATPRQADQWLGRRWTATHRRALRWAGFALLALSFMLLPSGGEQARAITSWIGALAIEALAAALLLRPATQRKSRRR
ncbi:DUF3325 family protein [Sphingomonas lycopersici]|uniref:DUF3325 family protein n=1 Tax=Sphingomonas lycopersici TaxID=2951807 RepID=A0AA41Z766_9SPHN|nr:DUF3325 family protein [Sphingomonas lycopersici]MCW6534104.1 DUF3325 family protein [Sphingomonas lycopersici]